MILRVLAFVCLVVAALVTSFLLPPERQQIVSAAAPRERPVPELQSPRIMLASARQSLSDVLKIDETVLSEAGEVPRITDAELVRKFRSELSAIVMNKKPPEVWLVDPATPGARRRLVQGDVYIEDWRVEQILPAQVILAAESQIVTVDVFAAAP